jgi:hypothetical protein
MWRRCDAPPPREEWERLLAILREELATKEAQLADAIARADRATDRCLALFGSRGVSAAGLQDAQTHAAQQAQLAQTLLADPYQEVPLGDPRGTFPTRADAALDGDEP